MTILLYDLVGADEKRPFSPHCWKVAMALGHKGLHYESVPTRFTGILKVEGGFSKTIPVIRDGDTLIADSFAIALYLEETYPERPSLFGGPGGQATARFIERWSQAIIHAYLGVAALLDIHEKLAPADQEHFKRTREARFGKPLHELAAQRDAKREGFRTSLEPLRSMLGFQPFIGGDAPTFADYIVFGAFQWVRVVSPYAFLDAKDPIASWFERCLDLHGASGRQVGASS